ncbi:MAG: SpoIIE family protein phosphatase [Bryobacterales bacterium]|nr:SpoIIE family protein phosphatase [Acidobacteriota bacterium]MCB9385234.1 SpoIIE family protein phosphatase [Bryobacterales bacterium]
MSRRDSTPPTVLLVDDDALITTSLQGLFALETDYRILAFNDPREAEKEAARRPIDIVISDFLMPGLNGVELLKRIRALQPDAVRILLTGFADKENAIRAINEVALYQYIEKPWDNDDLLLLLRNALSERNLRRQLADKVHELDKLVERHTQLADRNDSIERDLQRAAAVQRRLLPERMPRCKDFEIAARFEPSDWLGGDFYDVCEKDGELILLLADVSGHGAHAALTSMLLKAVFHECVRLSDGPQQVLEEMNQRLYLYLPPEMFACAAVLWIGPDAEMRLANGGLPYPWVVRRQGLDELPVAGLPLGMFADSEMRPYESRTLRLEAGETLLLASDGLGEVRDAEGRFYQDQRLRAALERGRDDCAGAQIDALLADAAEFREGQAWPDDVSLIALRRA